MRSIEENKSQSFSAAREFLIKDLSELAHIYGETHRALQLLVNIHGTFEPLQPFLPL